MSDHLYNKVHDPLCPTNWMGVDIAVGEDMNCWCDRIAEVRADEREHIESAQLPMLAGILSSAGGTVRVPVAQQMLLDGVVTRMDEVDGTAVFRYLPAAARGDGERG